MGAVGHEVYGVFHFGIASGFRDSGHLIRATIFCNSFSHLPS
jgi:hypothetical protein